MSRRSRQGSPFVAMTSAYAYPKDYGGLANADCSPSPPEVVSLETEMLFWITTENGTRLHAGIAFTSGRIRTITISSCSLLTCPSAPRPALGRRNIRVGLIVSADGQHFSLTD